MDTAQVKGRIARLGELIGAPHDTPKEREAGKLMLNLLEDFLLDHKRQTELLEGLANTAEFFEYQRRELGA